MSRRRSRPRRKTPPVSHAPSSSSSSTAVSPDAPCPCGLPASLTDCCGRFHRGQATAPTAEALMRSRYSAFAVRDRAYLLRTWHPDTAPKRLETDPETWWRRLEILGATGGSPFHTEGAVSFRAHFTERGREGVMEEHSRFVRHAGAWVYLDASGTPRPSP